MKKMGGQRKTQDPILADIQRAFGTGYHQRRERTPSRVASSTPEELYAATSALSTWERRRFLDSWSTQHPGNGSRSRFAI